MLLHTNPFDGLLSKHITSGKEHLSKGSVIQTYITTHLAALRESVSVFIAILKAPLHSDHSKDTHGNDELTAVVIL